MSCKIEEGYDIMKVRLNNEEGYMIVVVLMTFILCGGHRKGICD
jgi:hypothetical protein